MVLPKIIWNQVTFGKIQQNGTKYVPMTLTRHELDVLHKFSWHSCLQAIRVKLNVEVAIIHYESNSYHLWNWMNP